MPNPRFEKNQLGERRVGYSGFIQKGDSSHILKRSSRSLKSPCYPWPSHSSVPGSGEAVQRREHLGKLQVHFRAVKVRKPGKTAEGAVSAKVWSWDNME